MWNAIFTGFGILTLDFWLNCFGYNEISVSRLNDKSLFYSMPWHAPAKLRFLDMLIKPSEDLNEAS